jgi:hypothetical protein
MQADSLQHKEMGQGPLGLETDPGRLHIVYLRLLEGILGRNSQRLPA